MVNSPTIDEIFARYYDSDEEKEKFFKQEYKLIADEQDIIDWKQAGNLKNMNNIVKKQRKSANMLQALMIEPHSSDDEVNINWKKEKSVMHLRRKRTLNMKKALYNKMMLLVRLDMIKGPMLIFLMLEIIKVAKVILVLELERGIEARIPKLLCNRDLAPSFQYYDCILEIMRAYTADSLKFYGYNNEMVETRRSMSRNWFTKHLLKHDQSFKISSQRELEKSQLKHEVI